MERRVIARLDIISDSVSRHDERIKSNKEEVDKLRTRSNYWDAGNTFGLVIAGILSAIGINK
jgi:hypothetical protein